MAKLRIEGSFGTLLVAPGESAPLASAIVELASNPERARELGVAGRKRALERFLEDRCTDRTELLYRSSLDQRTPTAA